MTSSGLKELRASIVAALKNGTVEQEYPRWIYDCREKYGISSYTLQLLIGFYQKLSDETDVMVSPLISDKFIDCTGKISKDDSTNNDSVKVEKAPVDQLKRKYSSSIFFMLITMLVLSSLLFYSFIHKSSEYENVLSEKISKERELKKYISKYDSLQSNYYSCRRALASEHIIGASRMNSNKSWDSNYVMWLNTKRPLKINSFYVMANVDGNVVLGLYDAKSQLISSFSATVLGRRFKKLYPSDFIIERPGFYYLAIVKSNGVSLSYHRTSSVEYDHFKEGALEITGCYPKGNNGEAARKSQDWYEYFYDINYSIN